MAADHNRLNGRIDPACGRIRHPEEARAGNIMEPLRGDDVDMACGDSLRGPDIDNLEDIPGLQRPDEIPGGYLRNGS